MPRDYMNNHMAEADPKHRETVRLILQSLNDMGYTESMQCLERESGFLLEQPHIREFREAIVDGQWETIDPVLPHLKVNPGSEQVR